VAYVTIKALHNAGLFITLNKLFGWNEGSIDFPMICTEKAYLPAP